MSAVPPVSIGLPVFNGARFLPRTLEDLLGQTYGDFELVICDNASTDETPDIIAAAADRDERVTVIRNKSNIGALPNTNLAFSRSRGHRYVLAAHDDRHAPDFLARLVAALDADPEAVLAFGASTLIGEDDRPFQYVPKRQAYVDQDGTEYRYDRALHRSLPDDPVARYRAVLHATNMSAPMYGLFRRSVLERIGPHRIHGSDRLVVAHAALLGRFAYVEAPLLGYRIHSDSTVHLTREEWIERDAGPHAKPAWDDGMRTLLNYMSAVTVSDLSRWERIRVAQATLAYAVRPQVLHRIFLPGPDNYWGWTRWPFREEVSSTGHKAVPDQKVEDGWDWLLKGEQAKLGRAVESFG